MKQKIELWLLRLAVAFPLVWAGVKEITNPSNWIGFVPSWVGKFIEPQTFLLLHGLGSLVIASGLLLPFARFLFAGVAFLNLASILIFYGIDDITFRDVGLALVALVLFLKELKPRHLSSAG